MYACMPCIFAWCQQKLQEVSEFPESGVRVDCELPCGHWGLKQGPLQEQHMHLTVELSLSLLISQLLFKIRMHVFEWNSYVKS